MRIASITPIYNAEDFVRPHFKQLSRIDENIVLWGRKPFKDYLSAGIYKQERDNTLEILKNEFPHVRIVEHDFEYLCGDLFNLGITVAKELGCDVVLKLDPDMLLDEQNWGLLIDTIKTMDQDVLMLDFKPCTMVYKLDFKHGVSCSVFPCGNDPLAIKVNQQFIQDGVAIKCTGSQLVTKGLMIHHFSGFKPNVDQGELRRIESLPGFQGWIECPKDIQEIFDEGPRNRFSGNDWSSTDSSPS